MAEQKAFASVLKIILITVVITACSAAPPVAFEIHDAAIFNQDVAFCKTAAHAVKHGLSAATIGEAGIELGARNAAGAAINPVVPVIAALGGSGAEFLSELDFLGRSERHLTIECLRRRGDRSGAYFILDPDD